MAETKSYVRLGDGIANNVKTMANEAMTDITKDLIGIFTEFAKEKIKEAPDKMYGWLNSKNTQDELVALWSSKLAQEGLVPKGYAGLSEKLLIANMHQDGYMAGLYVGYILAMMGLVDNVTDEELILSVRDYIRPNLIGHHYDDKEQFCSKYRDKKYSWVEKAIKDKEQ